MTFLEGTFGILALIAILLVVFSLIRLGKLRGEFQQHTDRIIALEEENEKLKNTLQRTDRTPNQSGRGPIPTDEEATPKMDNSAYSSENSLECSLQNGNLQTFDLPMTVDGFAALKQALKHEVGKPQVYIHVGNEGPINNEVLRIGSAKNGTRTRWYATNGHESTFLWSIGESERYKKDADTYPHYLAFFAGLYELDTKLHVITCESAEQMLSLEKRLSKKRESESFYPIWESYRDNINRRYFRNNPDFRTQFSAYGGALDLMTRQRNGEVPLSDPAPDVLVFHSARKWSAFSEFSG